MLTVPTLARGLFKETSPLENKSRAVARSENLGGHIVLGRDNVPLPLVEIGLTGLPKMWLWHSQSRQFWTEKNLETY